MDRLRNQRGGRVNSDECRDYYRDPASCAGLSVHPDGCRDMVPELIEGLEDRAEPEGLEGTIRFTSPFGRKMVPEFTEGRRGLIPQW